MKGFIHPINPNYSAEHMDTYAEGWLWGIWEHGTPALRPDMYRIQSQHRQAAEESLVEFERATAHLPNAGTAMAYTIPAEMDPHGLHACQRMTQSMAN